MQVADESVTVQNEIVSEWIGGCTPDDFLPLTVTKKRTVTNLPESRPRPTPLFLHPTSQAKQWTFTERFGRYFEDAMQWDWTCVPPARVIRRAWKRDTESYGVPADAPQPDWALKMRLKIKDEFVNLAASLAEMPETVGAFHGYVRGAWDVYRCLRKRNRNRRCPKLRSCDVTMADIDASFNLRPLTQDLHDSIEKLSLELAEPVWKRLTASDRRELAVEPHGSARHHWVVTERARLYCQLDTAGVQGFSMGNPAELAWELIPFSFIVDQGIPIGNWLSSLDALRGVSNIIGTVTRKETCMMEKWDVTAAQTRVENYTGKYRSHSRSVIFDIPLPQLPTWSPSKAWQAIKTDLSLLHQMSEGCKEPRERYWKK